jgi:hypothetical protein
VHNLILLGSMTAGPAAARKFRAGRRHEFKHGFFAKKRPLPRHHLNYTGSFGNSSLCVGQEMLIAVSNRQR